MHPGSKLTNGVRVLEGGFISFLCRCSHLNTLRGLLIYLGHFYIPVFH